MDTIEWMRNMPVGKIRSITKQYLNNTTESYKQSTHRIVKELCDEIEAYESILLKVAEKHPKTLKSLNVELPRSAEEIINSVEVKHIKVS